MERIPRRQYTAEFKHEAVKLVLEQGVGVRETARRLDLPVGSLRNWVDAARTGKARQSETARPVTDLEHSIEAGSGPLEDGEGDPKKPPSWVAAPHMCRNTRCVHWRPRLDSGRLLFGGVCPRQKTWPRGSCGPSCGGTARDPV